MQNKFFECGCSITDESDHNWYTRPVLRRCKKHQRDMKPCSWSAWAKKNAPAQYAEYRKDIRR